VFGGDPLAASPPSQIPSYLRGCHSLEHSLLLVAKNPAIFLTEIPVDLVILASER
jgi:hypothetical protein